LRWRLNALERDPREGLPRGAKAAGDQGTIGIGEVVGEAHARLLLRCNVHSVVGPFGPKAAGGEDGFLLPTSQGHERTEEIVCVATVALPAVGLVVGCAIGRHVCFLAHEHESHPAGLAAATAHDVVQDNAVANLQAQSSAVTASASKGSAAQRF
jgi:hypothetical protein